MIVVDTNVLVRGIRSNSSASGYILRLMLGGEIAFALSPAIVLEYEDVLKRQDVLGSPPLLSNTQIDVVLDALCAMAHCVSPWFHFRPFLSDPKDDLYVECAMAAAATHIISHDRHFHHPIVEKFGLNVLSAREYVTIHRNLRSAP